MKYKVVNSGLTDLGIVRFTVMKADYSETQMSIHGGGSWALVFQGTIVECNSFITLDEKGYMSHE